MPEGKIHDIVIRPRPWHQPVIAVVLLTAITGAMFGDVLAARPGVVLSNPASDMALEFAPVWQFAFGQLAQGNLVLWNPYIYGGAPLFGNFQSALLYPPNWLFMALPLDRAINLTIVLHVLILGLNMYAWGRVRGLSLPAGLLAAVIAMFASPFFLHIGAGHHPHLCTMAWAPLVMAAIDGCFDRRTLKWALLGALALVVMLLAGFPQHVLFTGITAGVYVTLRLAGQITAPAPVPGQMPEAGRQVGRIAALLMVIVVAGAAIAAVQLLTGLEAYRHSVRALGLPMAQAGSFSFPPANLLTLVTPKFFGGAGFPPYWGRWNYWEMTLFVSISGLLLAVLGAAAGRVTARWATLAALGATLLLAMGMYTPLYAVLYAHLPVFQQIRGMSKFIFQASLLLAVLAGAGLDYLLTSRRPPWRLCAAATLAAIGAVAAALWIRSAAAKGPAGPWQTLVAGAQGFRGQVDDWPLLMMLARNSMESLFIAAGVLLLCALLLGLTRRWRGAPYALALLAAVELIVLASDWRPTFDMGAAATSQEIAAAQARQDDSRVLNTSNANHGMLTGRGDVWGRGPEVRGRWAQYIYFTQGEPLRDVYQYCAFTHWERRRMFAPTRLGCTFMPDQPEGTPADPAGEPMERLTLVPQWRVLWGRDEVLAAMLDESFDPRRMVILEQPPGLGDCPAATSTGTSSPASPGSVRCTQRGTDSSVIEADLSAPAILLITDAYDPAWRATALAGSSQATYTLTSGDWAFQAVPLKAGHHRLRLEYRPAAFEIGKWVSLVSLVLYASAWLWLWQTRKRTRPRVPG